MEISEGQWSEMVGRVSKLEAYLVALANLWEQSEGVQDAAAEQAADHQGEAVAKFDELMQVILGTASNQSEALGSAIQTLARHDRTIRRLADAVGLPPEDDGWERRN